LNGKDSSKIKEKILKNEVSDFFVNMLEIPSKNIQIQYNQEDISTILVIDMLIDIKDAEDKLLTIFKILDTEMTKLINNITKL